MSYPSVYLFPKSFSYPEESKFIVLPVFYDFLYFGKTCLRSPLQIMNASNRIYTFHMKYNFDVSELSIFTEQFLNFDTADLCKADRFIHEFFLSKKTVFTRNHIYITICSDRLIMPSIITNIFQIGGYGKDDVLLVVIDAHNAMNEIQSMQYVDHFSLGNLFKTCANNFIQSGVRFSSLGEDKSYLENKGKIYDFSSKKLYLSIDGDVLDLMIASTKYGEPFGWTWEFLRQHIFSYISACQKLIGFDIGGFVSDGKTELYCAYLLKEILTYAWVQKKI